MVVIFSVFLVEVDFFLVVGGIDQMMKTENYVWTVEHTSTCVWLLPVTILLSWLFFSHT